MGLFAILTGSAMGLFSKRVAIKNKTAVLNGKLAELG